MEATFGFEPVILMYHRFSTQPALRRVSAAAFDQQMAYLAHHCHVIDWTALIAGLRDGARWHRNTVVISIDDGYSDLYDVAFPVLRKYCLPATAFVTSGFTSGEFWHWADKLQYILETCRSNELELVTTRAAWKLLLHDDEVRWRSWHQLADHSYELSDDLRDELISELARAAAVTLPDQPPSGFMPATWDQLRSMIAAGVTIGAHSATHPRLTRLSDVDLVEEIKGGKRALEGRLQVAVDAFAYPFGTPADHDARVREVVRRVGFQSGCVAYFDRQLHRDLYALRRFGVGGDYWDFLKTVDGLKRARLLQKERDADKLSRNVTYR